MGKNDAKCIISCLFFFLDSKKEDKKEDSRKEESDRGDMICPLCQEGFKDKDTLEQHAMQLHSINAEGLQRLMMLMQGSHWLNSIKNANKEDEERDSGKLDIMNGLELCFN